MVITIDRELERPQYSEICMRCKHFNPNNWGTCTAFKDEIPVEIWLGENDHQQPFPGDNGIQFEAK